MTASEFGSTVVLVGNTKIDTFVEYQFASNFLMPCDAWQFKIGDETVTKQILEALKPGTRVQILIAGKVQSNGYIDKVEIMCGRSGTTINVSGRDVLSPVVDAMLHPKTIFTNTTLDSLLLTVLKDYGFTVFDITNDANITKATGRDVGKRVAKKPKKLNEFKPHSGKPHQNEGVFAFLSRVLQRYGLWIWPSVDGGTIIVGTPNYDQPARYSLTHKLNGPNNNVEESHVCWDSTSQPSYIIARGNIPPTEFDRAVKSVGLQNSFKFDSVTDFTAQANAGFVTNLAAGTTPGLPKTFSKPARTAFDEFLSRNPGEVETISIPALPVSLTNRFASSVARPVWLKDDESRTHDELVKFAMREMSLHIRHAFTANYTIMGHELNGQPVCVDTIISVDDDRSGVHENLWVIAVNHRKSRSGQYTDLELIPIGALSF